MSEIGRGVVKNIHDYRLSENVITSKKKKKSVRKLSNLSIPRRHRRALSIPLCFHNDYYRIKIIR